MREAGHAYSSTSGNDSDGDMIPPWAKRNATVITKFDRLKSTRAIVDEDSTDDDETDKEEEEEEDDDDDDDDELKVTGVPRLEQREGLDHRHDTTTTSTKNTAHQSKPHSFERRKRRRILSSPKHCLHTPSKKTPTKPRKERCYRVLDAFSGCIRGYAFDEPKQLVAIWVQIAAFARGLKSKGSTLSAVWEDARKLRDETFAFAFEAVWRAPIYPSIMCSGDDECAVGIGGNTKQIER